MFPRTTRLCRLLIPSVALFTVASLKAQLASRSPFQPATATGPNAPAADAPLEFGGYLDTPSEGRLYRITIKDPARRAAVWVRMNERNSELGSEVVVKQHDNDQETLTVEHGGKTLTLAEKKAKIVSAGSAAQAMPPPPVPNPPSNVPSAVTQAVVLNPTPADEQRRLEAVAAEVARRRALREQATQQQGNPSPQPMQIQQQPQAMPQPAGGQPQRVMPNTRQQR
jgi:hypothetical protein